jgi:hypothetical protein
MGIRKTELTSKEKSKTESDLKFLAGFLRRARGKNLRVVVSGGYGLDGLLGEITRAHEDLDLIVYGKITREKARKILEEIVEKICSDCQITKAEKNQFYLSIDFNKKGFGLNLYFVQTIKDPSENILRIRLKNGKEHVNSEKRFPLPLEAKVKGLAFESQNPNLHLADILFKTKKGKKKKHQQDIYNLSQITDKEKVEEILSGYE